MADQLTNRTFPADVSNIASASSAVAHVRTAAAARSLDTAPLQAVQSILDRAITSGHGGDSYARPAQFSFRPAARTPRFRRQDNHGPPRPLLGFRAPPGAGDGHGA
jgi:hypothetical protein